MWSLERCQCLCDLNRAEDNFELVVENLKMLRINIQKWIIKINENLRGSKKETHVIPKSRKAIKHFVIRRNISRPNFLQLAAFFTTNSHSQHQWNTSQICSSLFSIDHLPDTKPISSLIPWNAEIIVVNPVNESWKIY